MNLNIIGVGTAATDGDIYFNPVMQIEDGRFELYSAVASYMRTFEWLGKSSRVDVMLPYANGRWDGLLQGEYASVRRDGPADPRIRFSMHLLGSPPLAGQELVEHVVNNPVRTTVGAAIAVNLPFGEYLPDRLINLGRNRLAIRPQLGVLHHRGPWQFELTTTLSFYGDNDEYLSDNRLEQDHQWFVQGHVIRSFARRFWGSVGAGFSFGGEANLNGVALDNEDRTRFLALSFGTSIGKNHAVKIAFVNAETNVLVGTDSNSLVMAWATNWGK